MLSILALLALLAAWILVSGGSDGGNGANGSNGKNPLPSITAGPSSSGPAISEAPGGRDESGDGDTSGADDGSGDGSADGSGAGAGDGSGDSAGPGSASGGGSAAGGGVADGRGGGGTGEQLPAGSGLPDCTAGAVKLTLRSVRNAYEPDDEPTFELIARNTSSSDCKVDLGPEEAVLTITQADGDDHLWSSADCPEGAGSRLFRVPAESRITHTVAWDREPSDPDKCATPAKGSAPAGTYLVEAQAPGLAKVQTSFVLEKD